MSLAMLQPRSAKGTVMVVDDSPANLKLMEGMLRSCGYNVRSFPGGRMALAAAGTNPPDLILLDINMPEMNGYEVCEQLKKNDRLSEVPVIFLSALNALDDKLQGFRSGGADYVSKPFQIEEVLARVDTHLELHRLRTMDKNDNRRLQSLVELQVGRIAEAQMATIFAIAKLAETRDDETGMHVERVQHFCGLLAARLGEQTKFGATIDHAWIGRIIHASPLHDIGKVAIPDHILLKPGRLTPEEFEIMKTHAAVGAQTLSEVYARYPDNQFIEMGIELARSHHEKWNGAGYPDALVGEEIPLCARILAVADCYDAIRSKRCYKLPVPHGKTCAIIAQDSGTHFDPQVAAAFSDISDKFDDPNIWIPSRNMLK